MASLAPSYWSGSALGVAVVRGSGILPGGRLLWNPVCYSADWRRALFAGFLGVGKINFTK